VPSLYAQHTTVTATFNYQGTIPNPQSFVVINNTGWLPSAQLLNDTGWLRASLSGLPITSSGASYDVSGSSFPVTLSVNPITLNAGTYTTTVHIYVNCTGYGCPSFSYDIIATLNVSVVPQYADDLRFNYAIGGSIPDPIRLSWPSQPGREATGISARSDQPWLQTSLTSTSTPTTLTVSVNPMNLAVGSYTGNVVIGNSANAWLYKVYLTVTPLFSVEWTPFLRQPVNL
jgi:hypothetical protein